ncbi:MAG: right-handed parallel beta-helix repeat-containing protein [Pseudomonadota bacterium]
MSEHSISGFSPPRKLFKLITVLCFGLSLSVATVAQAATYYVATTGSDSNPGTQAAPFKNVQKAVGVVMAGDSVFIRAGSHRAFALRNINGAAGAPITFQGEPGAIIDRNLGGGDGNRNIAFVGGSYITIDGLELIDSDQPQLSSDCMGGITGRNGIKFDEGNGLHPQHITVKNMNIHGILGSAILGSSDYLQFINNHIHDNGGKKFGATIGAYGTYIKGRYNLISGNRVHNNSGNGIRTGNSTETGMSELLVDSIIENNIVYNNGGESPGGSASHGRCKLTNLGDGIVVWHGSGNIIRNNIVYGSVGYGIRVNEDFGLNDKPNLVYNNTVYKNGYQGLYCYEGNKTIVKNNISFLSGRENIFSGCTNQLSNNLTTDPKFVNPGSGDFGLQADSPAIDGGLDLKAEVPNDFMGTARPQPNPGKYDIGAFEGAGSKANVLPGVGAGIPGGGGIIPGGGGGVGHCYK